MEYFVNGRPSFKRFCKRFKKDFGFDPTRELYLQIKSAIRAEDLSTLEQLLFATNTEKGYKITKVTVTRWAANKQIKAEMVPEFPVTPQPFRPSGFYQPNIPAPTLLEDRSILVIPDSQNGFIRMDDGSLVPSHSRDCWNLAIQLAAFAAPAHIVLLGDMVDLPVFSRFKQNESMRALTQRALDETWFLLSQLRAAAPTSEIHYLYGNHEARYENALSEANDEYVGIKRAGTEERVNSLIYLLRLNELHIKVAYPYRTSIFIDNIEFTHGDIVGATSSATVGKLLSNATQSVVCGHVHRAELAYKTLWENGVPRDIFAMIPGCICDPDYTPPFPTRGRNWQQALGFIQDGNPEIIKVTGDEIRWRGLVFRAEVFPQLGN